jgi:hypothetical protein
MERGASYGMNIRTDTRQIRAGGLYGARVTFLSENLSLRILLISIPPDTWTQIASTYNGRQLKIFVNGRLAKKASVAGATCIDQNPLATGARNVPAKGVFNGMLDDVRAYNNPVSATQI